MDKHKTPVSIDYAKCAPCSGLICMGVCGEGINLILRENVLAVLSDAPLNTISSAFHNGGGVKKTRAILNVEVLKSCSDQYLHDNPELYITASAKRFGLEDSFIGMVPAAAGENFP